MRDRQCTGRAPNVRVASLVKQTGESIGGIVLGDVVDVAHRRLDVGVAPCRPSSAHRWRGSAPAAARQGPAVGEPRIVDGERVGPDFGGDRGVAPRWASRRAATAPMPELAPVMTKVFPVMSWFMNFLLRSVEGETQKSSF